MLDTSKDNTGASNRDMMRVCMVATIVGLLVLGIGIHVSQFWVILPSMGWVVWAAIGFFDYRKAWNARTMALAAMAISHAADDQNSAQ